LFPVLNNPLPSLPDAAQMSQEGVGDQSFERGAAYL